MITLPTIYPVTCHTDHVGPGSTFVAIEGFNLNGLTFIPLALQKGAERIVVQESAVISDALMEHIHQHGAHLLRVPNARRALAELSAQAHGNPASKLKIIGITGTKGKTTSAFLMEHVLRSAGKKTALISTVYNMINGIRFEMRLTTPQPDYLHVFLKKCVEARVDYVVMEAAAQAFTMHRLDTIQFDGAIFTNFDCEHAEFYATLDDYFAAKCAIIDHCKPNAPIIVNGDDAWCKKIPVTAQIKRFGFETADDNARILSQADPGISVALAWENQEQILACPALIGTFNGYNVLGVVSLALMLGIPIDTIRSALSTFTKVPGRFEQHPLPNGARCIIDYAHNPSSYQAVLSTLRSLTDHLIVVFGCGGNRDQSKRPIMGALAARFADHVILTSDNPRSEDPAIIVREIAAGIPLEHKTKVMQELDRALAIKKAYELCRPTSIMVLLGKGPDEYQIIGNIKTRFSEAEIVRSLR